MFSRIRGQQKVIDILQRAISSNKISHSYLFQGNEGIGKFTTALYFLMALNCQGSPDKKPCGECLSCQKYQSFSHPDFLYLFPSPNLEITPDKESGSSKSMNEYDAFIMNKINTPWKEFFFSGNVEIRINRIRLLENHINLTPHEGKFKTYLIENAEMMNHQAANAFLKTLEEPPADAVIVLTTDKPSTLLPTIVSRCQRISFLPLSSKTIEEELINKHFLENVEAKMYARIASGSMEKALRLAQTGSMESREKTIELLRIILDKDDLKFLSFAEEYRSPKSQNKLQEIISHLNLWISDLTYLKILPEDIINLDHTDLLENLYRKNPHFESNAVQLVDFMESMRRKLEGNINPHLILTGIYHKFLDTLNI
ncbi:MAG: DNA polymerase III subunit delta' [Candidatus Cloacimonetes bacterium]|nr:DNA polymerase III subunit delta' [Candidatus Cloacimonadota bacterium]